MRIVIALLAIGGLQSLSGQVPGDVPESLNPPPREKLLFSAHATGAQVYECNGSAWMLTGPDAKLFDPAGRQIGTHVAGPAWQGMDGSRVKATTVVAATPDANAIPWILLRAVDYSGRGIMEEVKSIQRLHTAGGKAPANGCDAAHKGAIARSPYAADYYFYGAGI